MTPGELVESFAPFVMRTLKFHSVAERDLDDVCQEVFIIVFRRLPEFDSSRPIRAWIYGICMKVAAAYRRRARHRREVLVCDTPEQPVSGASAGTDVVSTQQLVSMLSRLDEDKRTVLILHEIEELPMAEIALIVDCPVKTAYSRLAAARKQMLVMMSKWNPRR